MSRFDLVRIGSDVFTYWTESLGSLADDLKTQGRSAFRQGHMMPYLVLVYNPISPQEADWGDSETEVSSIDDLKSPTNQRPSEFAAALAKSSRNPREPRITIGRSHGNDIIVRSPKISKLHAAIFLERSRYHVLDMGSSNGTQVNNHRLKTGEPKRLKGGEVIELWRYQFKFLLPDALIRLLGRYRPPH